jgi:hypothetical protein
MHERYMDQCKGELRGVLENMTSTAKPVVEKETYGTYAKVAHARDGVTDHLPPLQQFVFLERELYNLDSRMKYDKYAWWARHQTSCKELYAIAVLLFSFDVTSMACEQFFSRLKFRYDSFATRLLTRHAENELLIQLLPEYANIAFRAPFPKLVTRRRNKKKGLPLARFAAGLAWSSARKRELYANICGRGGM